jgi:hypothetical protein
VETSLSKERLAALVLRECCNAGTVAEQVEPSGREMRGRDAN